jgi:isopenicillin N synthase-like dioxygenase
LVGASADGLQILTKQNEWVGVTSLPEQIVVNVGDMLQRLTNNRLRSTTHRVVNPPRELWGTSRFSIPFFLHPKGSMSLPAWKVVSMKRARKLMKMPQQVSIWMSVCGRLG